MDINQIRLTWTEKENHIQQGKLTEFTVMLSRYVGRQTNEDE